MRWLLALTLTAMTLASASFAATGTALAQGTSTVSGTLRSGTTGASFDARSVPVTLTVLEGVTSVDERTAAPAADGTFAFDGIVAARGRTYFFDAEYQGAVYSATLEWDQLGQPVSLQVFEATSDTDILKVESHSVVVTGVVRKTRTVEVLELVRVRNTSDRTLIPQLGGSGPAMLSFLRFALPPGASHLDVRSNLVGGQVLEVDRGFALTTPIPPTPTEAHSFEFVYQVQYTGPSLDLSRTMRFGASTVRAVVPASVGLLRSPQMTDLGSTELNGRVMQLLESADLARGARVELLLEGLPTPTLADKLTRDAGTWATLVVAPVLVAGALGILLLLGLRRRRGLGPVADPAAHERWLWERLTALEERRRVGQVSLREYEDERDVLRGALIEVDLRSRFRLPDDP